MDNWEYFFMFMVKEIVSFVEPRMSLQYAWLKLFIIRNNTSAHQNTIDRINFTNRGREHLKLKAFHNLSQAQPKI